MANLENRSQCSKDLDVPTKVFTFSVANVTWSLSKRNLVVFEVMV